MTPEKEVYELFRKHGAGLGKVLVDLVKELEKTGFPEHMNMTKMDQYELLDGFFGVVFKKGGPLKAELEVRLSVAYAIVMTLAPQLCDVLSEMKIPVSMKVGKEIH